MLLVVLKNVLCVVADGLSKNVDFFIVRKNIFIMKKKYFHREEKYFITMKKQFTWKRFRFPIC